MFGHRLMLLEAVVIVKKGSARTKYEASGSKNQHIGRKLCSFLVFVFVERMMSAAGLIESTGSVVGVRGEDEAHLLVQSGVHLQLKRVFQLTGRAILDEQTVSYDHL